MSTAATPPAGIERASATPPRGRLSRLLSTALVTVVGLLLVHVLFETWAKVLTGASSEDRWADLDDVARWPGQLESLLFLGLAGITAVKVVVDRLWGRFRTAADLTLLVLGLVMVLAGVVNDSPPGLMAQALFVYFRGVLVFYALRAADLRPTMIRRLLLVMAAVVGLNVLLALVQLVVGPPVYRALGWVDLTWADQGRAQGLQPDPNRLGQLLGLTLLGVIAWVAVQQRVRRIWWAVTAALALALSAAQSPESLLGVLVAGVLIAVLVRSGARRVLTVCLILVFCTVAQVAARPESRAEWDRFANALSNSRHTADSERPSMSPLNLQQAADVLPRQPLLGFGIGQFGGPVAEKNNPDWHRNPKFGPEGLRPGVVQAVPVDSFWLHLVLETGVLGLIAFVVWLFFAVQPLLRAARPGRPTTRRRAPPPPTMLWGIGAVVFAGLAALRSPAFEDALLPALLWTVLGLAWWAWRRSQEEEAALYNAATAMLPVIRDPSDVRDVDTRILDTDEILRRARRVRAERGAGGGPTNAVDQDTEVITTEEILALARRIRRDGDGASPGSGTAR